MAFLDDAKQALGLGDLNAKNLRLLDSCRANLLPFVGAGLSADFGYPSWNKLVNDLADEAGLSAQVSSHLRNNNFEEAAELVAEALPNTFDDTLRDIFDAEKTSRPLSRSAVCSLPLLSTGLVITTNFDAVLEMAFEDAGLPFRQVFSGTQIRQASRAVQLNEHCLLKLHGDYRDSEHRVLTLTEYEREYGALAKGVDEGLGLPKVLAQALTARPILFLGCSLRTDRTIGVITALANKYPGTVHFAVLSAKEATPDRRRQLDKWNIRPLFYPERDYAKLAAFLACLALYGQPPSSPSRVALKTPAPPKIRINGFKLFYFRRMAKLGTNALAKKSGLPVDVIIRLERINQRLPLGSRWFHQCQRDQLTALETALGCQGKLEAGGADDFLTEYMLFYKLYRGTRNIDAAEEEQLVLSLFETKAVVFDFDGTLTSRTTEETTWERMWLSLGYPIDRCSALHHKFSKGQIGHQEWCDLTLQQFRDRRFSRKHLSKIALDTRLIEHAEETLQFLRSRNMRLFVLSGSVKQIIRAVLGDMVDMFEDIQANEMVFDRKGLLTAIRGTRYDFEGKRDYLNKLIKDSGYQRYDVLFVGNSCNDVFASQSGARTLCVNPRMVDAYNKLHWTYFIRQMDSLRQILPYSGL
jgi:HAD superfamily phosphoserine phosphatase-like hydrolase